MLLQLFHFLPNISCLCACLWYRHINMQSCAYSRCVTPAGCQMSPSLHITALRLAFLWRGWLSSALPLELTSLRPSVLRLQIHTVVPGLLWCWGSKLESARLGGQVLSSLSQLSSPQCFTDFTEMSWKRTGKDLYSERTHVPSPHPFSKDSGGLCWLGFPLTN